MGADVSKMWRIASLALGLAALPGVFLIAAQPSGVVGARSISPAPAAGSRPQGSPTATPACAPAWNVVSSPNAGNGSDLLVGVAAVSANDVWAVGYYSDGRTNRTLIEHWDGSSWSVVSGPNPATSYYGELYGVAAVSANDVWAVGSGGLVEHWDGRSWSLVSSPNPPGSDVHLNGVAAVSANDVWAVGDYYYSSDHDRKTLVEHWNGSSWSIVPSPNAASIYGENVLKAVAAVSANDVWAVGYYYRPGPSQPYLTLVEHWNGTQWSIVPSANYGALSNNRLRGVAAVSANDVWAVGDLYSPFSPSPHQTLIEHWNGSSWSLAPSPDPPSSPYVGLYAVTAVSPGDVWAVGTYYNSGGTSQTLIEHWNGSSWSVVSNPNPPSTFSEFRGIAAVSANDVWAVGHYANTGSPYQTLLERWNGASWSVVSGPNPGPASDHLTGVSALSADDVWAVGYYYNARTYQPLIEHWDGTSWREVPGPSLTISFGVLHGIAAVSANDVWAVGWYAPNKYDSGQTLVAHWNGSNWSIVPSPSTPHSSFRGIAAISANDVWAVGHYRDNDTGNDQTLVAHWNGSGWSIVPSPNPGASDNALYGVAAVSANVAWAVGYYCDNPPYTCRTLVARWNGSSWSVVPSPNPGRYYNGLNAVAATSANDAWAVGYYSNDYLGPGPAHALVERWNGSSWSVVPGSDAGSTSELRGVAAISGGNVWATGYYVQGGTRRTLVQHWNGSSWRTVFSPNPGPTDSGLEGISGTAAGNIWAVGDYFVDDSPFQTLVERYGGYGGPCLTPTPTATPCPVNFADVQPSDNFYEAVRYLYCRGVISGYGDGTFRPYNLTTRAQFCKIAVLAEGWDAYIPSFSHFRDVPATHPFYGFIEAAYDHGIISGYSCGGGCLEFRPGNNVTRGQVCKVVGQAEGWPIYTPPAPTFNDVPTTHTFYPYIETAYRHGIISGYNCGPGCLEFRPGNNATRGQLCKIVYQAIAQP